MGDRTFQIDANLGFADGALAQTASGYAQWMGADGLIDLGGTQNATITQATIADVASITPQQARIDAWTIIDLLAVKTSALNELYKVSVVGSNDVAFGPGNVAV